MGLMRLALLALSILGLSACTEPPKWTLFYYSDVTALPATPNAAQHIAGYYASLAQCQAKGSGMIRLSDSGIGYFQCGNSCLATPEGGVKCDSLIEN